MSTKRIQGITVEIGGDTSKLTAALKEVDHSLSTTQGNLRDVNKLLKLDPGNTELLAQKHKLLAEAIKETKERLATLKTAAEQANQALANGEITQTQYDALQREIIETEEKLKGLESQAGASAVALQKIANVGTSFQNVGGKIEGVGRSLIPLSTAVAGIGAAGIKVATDFEKGMSGVRAITGATGADFEKLRDTAIDLGASTSFSSGEVAEAMMEMAKAGWSTTQIIEGMAGVLDATAASGENLGSVATIVADAITGFGLSAKDSAMVADLMTQAANSGTIGITDLGESYKYVAPMAQSMGLSIQDVTTAISAMSMAGIKGSQAGTALRTVLANMAKPSKTVAEAMDELDICITNSDGSFKSLNEIVSIIRTKFSGLTDDQKAYYATAMAGKEGMSGLLSLLNLTQSEYDELSASMNNCTGIAGQTASVMQDNLQSKVEQLGGALESLAIKLGEYVIPFLTELVVKITSAVDAFSNLNPGIQKAILIIGGIIAVAAPLLIIIGKVISAVGTIMTILPAIGSAIHVVTGAFGALNVVMLANPIGLIIAAIVALIAIFVLLWKNCDGFREFWINLWESIKEGVSKAVSAIGDFISKAWQGIKDVTSKIWSGIKDLICGYFQFTFENNMKVAKAMADGISTAWGWISENTSKAWSNIKEGTSKAWVSIKESTSKAWESIKTNHETMCKNIAEGIISTWTFLKESTAKLWSGIKDTVSSIGSAISDTVRNLWQGIKDTTESIHNSIKNVVDNVLSGIRNLYESFSSTVKDIGSSLWENVKGVFQAGLDFVHDLVTNKLGSLVSSIGNFFSNIYSGITSKLESIKNAVSGCLSNLTAGLSSAMGNITAGLSNAFFNIGNAFSNLASNAFGWGKDLISNMIDGIGAMIGKLVDKVKDIAGTIADYLHFTEPDKGPLSNFHTYMPDMIDLLGKGIEENLHKLKAPMTALGNTMIPASGQMAMEVGAGSNSQSNDQLAALSDVIMKYLPKMAKSQIVLDSGTLVGELSDGLNRQLGKAYL